MDVDQPDEEPTLYDILGVRVQANPDVLRRAWLLAAREQHPDLHAQEGRDRYAERMQTINAAYQVLSDPERRRRYDLEHGLIDARCGRCGNPGSLRLDERGQTIPVCKACLPPRRQTIAL